MRGCEASPDPWPVCLPPTKPHFCTRAVICFSAAALTVIDCKPFISAETTANARSAQFAGVQYGLNLLRSRTGKCGSPADAARHALRVRPFSLRNRYPGRAVRSNPTVLLRYAGLFLRLQLCAGEISAGRRYSSLPSSRYPPSSIRRVAGPLSRSCAAVGIRQRDSVAFRAPQGKPLPRAPLQRDCARPLLCRIFCCRIRRVVCERLRPVSLLRCERIAPRSFLPCLKYSCSTGVASTIAYTSAPFRPSNPNGPAAR